MKGGIQVDRRKYRTEVNLPQSITLYVVTVLPTIVKMVNYKIEKKFLLLSNFVH